MEKRNVKCREYDACRKSCLQCDMLADKKCDKEFNPEIPQKYISVERTDHIRVGWNECPACGCSIGYRPEIKDFRCPRCGQRIVWA